MISRLRPYPEYKESLSPWIEKIPSHWNVPRLGSVLRERNEFNEGLTVEKVLSVLKDIGVIPYEEKGNIGNKKSDDIRRYKIVRPDDIVVNCMNVIIGSVGRSKHTGCLSPVYYVLTRRNFSDNPQYLAAVFTSKPFQKSLVRIGNGIMAHRMRIPMELLKCEPFPIPPGNEQDSIVRFLNWANGQLERAIRAKRKTIGLLNEQKQAIIHRAVTRGLNPNAPMKPSGIPWLKEIPQHWNLYQARHIGQFHKGVGGSKEDNLAAGVPCIRYGELYTTFQNFITGARSFVSQERSAFYVPIRYGDVLFAASGEKVNEIGKSAVNLMTEPAVCGGDVVILRLAKEANTPFLGYAFDTYHTSNQKATMCRGTTIKHIYPDELKSLWIPFPPISEQEKITAYLDKELKRFNAALDRTQREIELIREYRTRLAADVVTGKLDVRAVAAKLPDENLTGEAAMPEAAEESETEESAI